MASSSSTERGRPRSALPIAVGGALGLLTLGVSAVGVVPFLIFGMLVAALACADISNAAARKGLPVRRVAAAASVLAFPAAAYLRGEEGIVFAAAAVFLMLASSYVVAGLRPEILKSLGLSLLFTYYVGVPAAYFMLIRGRERGVTLMASFVLILVCFHLARLALLAWVGAGRAPGIIAGHPVWWGAVAGIAGSLLGALGSSLLVDLPAGGAMVLPLGAIAGLGAAVGDLAGRLLRSDVGLGERESTVPGYGGLAARLDTLLLSAPAFFYGFRLYLT